MQAPAKLVEVNVRLCDLMQMALSGAKLNAYSTTLCSPLPNIRVFSDDASNSKSEIDTTELGIESVPVSVVIA